MNSTDAERALSATILTVVKGASLGALVAWTITANSLVFVVLYKNPKLQTVPNFLVGNLAFSDLCLSVIVLPMSALHAVAESWLLGKTVCVMWVSADILCCTASIWNLSIVGLDRYWAITSPVAYMRRRTHRLAAMMIASVWALAAVVSLSPTLGWKQMAQTGNFYVDRATDTEHCSFLDLPSYTIYSATGSFFVPLLLMFFVYCKIYQAFAKREAKQRRKKVGQEIRNHVDESIFLHEVCLERITDARIADDSLGEAKNVTGERTVDTVAHRPPTGNYFRTRHLMQKRSKRSREKCNAPENSIVVPGDGERAQMEHEGPNGNGNNSITACPAGEPSVAYSSTPTTPVLNTPRQSYMYRASLKQLCKMEKPANSRAAHNSMTSISRTLIKQLATNDNGAASVQQVSNITQPLTKKPQPDDNVNVAKTHRKASNRKTSFKDQPPISQPLANQPSISQSSASPPIADQPSATESPSNSQSPATSLTDDISHITHSPGTTHPQATFNQSLPSDDVTITRPSNEAVSACMSMPLSSMPQVTAVDGTVAHRVKAPFLRKQSRMGRLTTSIYSRSRNLSKRRLRHMQSRTSSKSGFSAAKERRGVKVLGIVLGCFTVCWAPFFVMYLMVQFCTRQCHINPHVEMFITWLGYSNSAMNPIIYTVFNREYQMALKKIFGSQTEAQPLLLLNRQSTRRN